VPGLPDVLAKSGVEAARARSLLQILLREKRLIRIGDDLVFHHTAMEKLRSMLAARQAARFKCRHVQGLDRHLPQIRHSAAGVSGPRKGHAPRRRRAGSPMKFTRRSLLLGAAAAAAGAQSRSAMAREITEWIFVSAKAYKDPFKRNRIGCCLPRSAGQGTAGAAFWAGGQEWRVRYAADAAGRYSFETICSDASNSDFARAARAMEVTPYEGREPIA